ncbi:MAG: hypothetical protein GY787_17375 [Alteromonadales bacterium]|nr:hypothetical protein [Alteromonadales bacterium]
MAVSDVAFAFIIKHPAIASVLPGLCNALQFERSQRAALSKLDGQMFKQLQAFWTAQVKPLNLGW